MSVKEFINTHRDEITRLLYENIFIYDHQWLIGEINRDCSISALSDKSTIQIADAIIVGSEIDEHKALNLYVDI